MEITPETFWDCVKKRVRKKRSPANTADISSSCGPRRDWLSPNVVDTLASNDERVQLSATATQDEGVLIEFDNGLRGRRLTLVMPEARDRMFFYAEYDTECSRAGAVEQVTALVGLIDWVTGMVDAIDEGEGLVVSVDRGVADPDT